MIALGCDHGGYELMQEVKKHLEERGLEYKDFGCNGPERQRPALQNSLGNFFSVNR